MPTRHIKRSFTKGKIMDKDFLKKLFESMGGGDLSASLNYKFACLELKDLWLTDEIPMEDKITSVLNVRKVCFIVLKLCNAKYRINVPEEFLNMEIHLVKGKGKRGAVIDVPNAKIECECNRVALILNESGEREYYTSEYYSMTNSFGLCKFTRESHASYGTRVDTLEDFLKALELEVAE